MPMQAKIQLISFKYVLLEGENDNFLSKMDLDIRDRWGYTQMTLNRQMRCKACDEIYTGYTMPEHLQSKSHHSQIQHWLDNVDPLYGNSCEDCPCLAGPYENANNAKRFICRLGYCTYGTTFDGTRPPCYTIGYMRQERSRFYRPQECIDKHG